MPSPHLRRLVIIPIAFLIALLAPNPSPLDAADPPSAHEAAILDRIFANWKAGRDRVRSLHFVWDCRTTYKKGSLDFTSTNTPRRFLKKDQVFQQFGSQLWVDGDDRMCFAVTRKFKVPEARLTDTDRVVIRQAIVGTTVSTFIAGWMWDTGASAPPIPPRGSVFLSTPDYQIFRSELLALFFAFRIQSPFLPWSKSEFRVVDENAAIDNGPAIKLKRSVEASGVNNPKHEEFYWVSPARDDAVVHWIVESPLVLPCEGSVKYKMDAAYGWIPSEWTFAAGGLFHECVLTQFSPNGKIDPALFARPFEPGTPVAEVTNVNMPLKAVFYLAQQDGSKQVITGEEFQRLVRAPNPANAQAAPKRPEK